MAYYHKEWYDWREAVLRCVRFRPDHAAISKELTAHYEDSVADFLRIGYEESLAHERALAAMGDPGEIGSALNAAHKPYLGYLLKLTEWTAFALAIMLLWTVVFQRGWEYLRYGVEDQLKWQTPPASACVLETEYGTICMSLTDPITEDGVQYQNLNFWMHRTDSIGIEPSGLRYNPQINTNLGPIPRQQQDENGEWLTGQYYNLISPVNFVALDSFTRFQWTVRLTAPETLDWAEVTLPYNDICLRAEREGAT